MQFVELSGSVTQQISILLASGRLQSKVSPSTTSTAQTLSSACKPSVEVCADLVFTWRRGSLSNSNTYSLRPLSASKAGNKCAEIALLGRK